MVEVDEGRCGLDVDTIGLVELLSWLDPGLFHPWKCAGGCTMCVNHVEFCHFVQGSKQYRLAIKMNNLLVGLEDSCMRPIEEDHQVASAELVDGEQGDCDLIE